MEAKVAEKAKREEKANLKKLAKARREMGDDGDQKSGAARDGEGGGMDDDDDDDDDDPAAGVRKSMLGGGLGVFDPDRCVVLYNVNLSICQPEMYGMMAILGEGGARPTSFINRGLLSVNLMNLKRTFSDES